MPKKINYKDFASVIRQEQDYSGSSLPDKSLVFKFLEENPNYKSKVEVDYSDPNPIRTGNLEADIRALNGQGVNRNPYYGFQRKDDPGKEVFVPAPKLVNPFREERATYAPQFKLNTNSTGGVFFQEDESKRPSWVDREEEERKRLEPFEFAPINPTKTLEYRRFQKEYDLSGNETPEELIERITKGQRESSLGSGSERAGMSAINIANKIISAQDEDNFNEKYPNSPLSLSQVREMSQDQSFIGEYSSLSEQLNDLYGKIKYNEALGNEGRYNELVGEYNNLIKNKEERFGDFDVSLKAASPYLGESSRSSRLNEIASPVFKEAKEKQESYRNSMGFLGKASTAITRFVGGGLGVISADLLSSLGATETADDMKTFLSDNYYLTKDSNYSLFETPYNWKTGEYKDGLLSANTAGFMFEQLLNMTPAIAAYSTPYGRAAKAGLAMLGTAAATYDDYSNEIDQAALEAGVRVDPQTRALLASAGALKTGIIENIIPIDRYLKVGLIGAGTKSAIKSLASGKGLGFAMRQIGAGSVAFLNAEGIEIGEEIIDAETQSVIDRFISRNIEGINRSEAYADPSVSNEELFGIIVNTAIAVAPLGGVSSVAAGYNFKNDLFHHVASMGKADQALSLFEQNKDNFKGDSFKKNTDRLSQIRDVYDEIPTEFDATSRRKIADNMLEIDRLDGQLKPRTPSSQRETIEKKITKLQNEINAIYQKEQGRVAPTAPQMAPDETSVQIELQVSESDQSVLNLISERIEPILNPLAQRMTNAEEIEMSEIESVAEQMIDEQSRILESENLSEEDKQSLSQLIESQIDNLLDYEFATITTTEQTGQARQVKGVVRFAKPGLPQKVSTDRFFGTPVTNPQTGERGFLVLTKVPITQSRTGLKYQFVSEAEMKRQKNGEYKAQQGILKLGDEVAPSTPFTNMEYVSSNFGEDGNLTSVVLRDAQSGTELQIDDQELALDIAIAESQRQIGTVPEGALLSTIQRVVPTERLVKVFPNLRETGTTPAAVGVEPQTEQDVRQETNAPQEGRGQGEDAAPVPQEEGRQEGQVTPPAVVQEGETPPATAKEPTKQPTEQKVGSTSTASVSDKKADIERRKQEEIGKIVSKYFPNSEFTDILYHATRGQERFEKFNENKIGELDSGYFGRGFYLTPERASAEGYARPYNGIVLYAVVNLQNPLRTDANQSNSGITLENYDGAIVTLGEDTLGISEEKYDPNQIFEVVLKKADQIQILSEEESRKVDEINAKYDAELAALSKKPRKTAQEKTDEGKAIVETLKEALRALKAKPGGGANIDLTFGVVPITKAVWNTAIDTAILAIEAGQSIAQAVKAASDYISSKIDGDWGKAKVEKYLEDRFGKSSPKPLTVFHAGTLEGKGNIYVSPIREQANEYSSMSGAPVLGLEINENAMAPESEVRDLIQSLGLKLPKGYNLDELFLYEALDTRVGSSLSQEDIDKLYESLKDRGYEGIAFRDEDIRGIKKEGIDNFIVFDKSSLSKAGEPQAQPMGVEEIAKALEGVRNPTALDKASKLIGGVKFLNKFRKRAEGDRNTLRAQEIDRIVNKNTTSRISIKGSDIVFKDGESLFDKLVNGDFTENEAYRIIDVIQDAFPNSFKEFYPDSFKDENVEDITSIIEEERFKRYINETLNKQSNKNKIEAVKKGIEDLNDEKFITGVTKKSINFIKDIVQGIENGDVFVFTEEQLSDLGLKKEKDNQIVESFDLAEAYVKAKADGSNPELVKAVDEVLGQAPEAKQKKTIAEKRKEFRETAKKYFEGMKKMGVIFDAERNAAEDIAFIKALKDYIKLEIDNGMVTFKGFIDKASALMEELKDPKIVKFAKTVWAKEVVKAYPKVYAKLKRAEKTLLNKEIVEARKELQSNLKELLSDKKIFKKISSLTTERKLDKSSSDILVGIRSEIEALGGISKLSDEQLISYNELATETYKEGRINQKQFIDALAKEKTETSKNAKSAITNQGERSAVKLKDAEEAREFLAENNGDNSNQVNINNGEVIVESVDDFDAILPLIGKGATFGGTTTSPNPNNVKRGKKNFFRNTLGGSLVYLLDKFKGKKASQETINFFNNLQEEVKAGTRQKKRLKAALNDQRKVAIKKLFRGQLRYIGFMLSRPKVNGERLVIKDNNGEEIKNINIAGVLYYYQLIKDPHFLKKDSNGERKIGLSESSMKDIVDFINLPENAKVRELINIDQLLIKQAAQNAAQVMEANNISSELFTPKPLDLSNYENDTFIGEILNKIYNNAVPSEIEYFPSNVESDANSQVPEVDALLDQEMDTNAVSAMSRFMIERVSGGKVRIRSYDAQLGEYFDSMSNTASKLPILKKFQAVFNKENSNLISSYYGKNTTDELRENIGRYITSRQQDSRFAKWFSSGPFSKWLASGLGVQMVFAFTSAAAQLTSIPGPILSYGVLNYLDGALMLASGKVNARRALQNLTKGSLFRERFGSRIEVADIVKSIPSDEVGFASYINEFNKKLISLGAIPSSAFDAFSIIFSLPIYAREYSNAPETMTEQEAIDHAENVLMDKAESFLQSKSDEMMSSFESENRTTFYAFATVVPQLARQAIMAFKRIQRGEGDLVQNINVLAWSGILSSLFFRAVRPYFESIFEGDDDDEELKKLRNDERYKRMKLDLIVDATKSFGGWGAAASIVLKTMHQLAEAEEDASYKRKFLDILPEVAETVPSVGIKVSAFTNALKSYDDDEYVRSTTQAIQALTNIPAEKVRGFAVQMSDAFLTDQFTLGERLIRLSGFVSENKAKEKMYQKSISTNPEMRELLSPSEIQRFESKHKSEYKNATSAIAKQYSEATTEKDRDAAMSKLISLQASTTKYSAKESSELIQKIQDDFDNKVVENLLPEGFLEIKRMPSTKKVNFVANEVIKNENSEKALLYLDDLYMYGVISENERGEVFDILLQTKPKQ